MNAITPTGDNDPQPTPPKEPEKIDCDADKTSRAQKVNAVYNTVKDLPDFKTVQGKAKEKGEGMLNIINDSGNNYSTINMNYIDGVQGSLPTSDLNHIICAGVHTHPSDMNDGPSPADLYHLLKGYKNNNKYTTDYVISGTGTEYAITINDPVAALAFLEKYPFNSMIRSDGHFVGSENEPGTPYFNFLDFARHLKKAGYPREMIDEYAILGMMLYSKDTAMGISLLKRESDGTFKELIIGLKRDENNKSVFSISQCK